MWKKQTIELGSDRSLHAVQAGEGPEVLLIHGALATHHDWLVCPVADALAREHRVTIIDRPGNGLSRRPRFSGTPRDQAAQIVEGMDRLGIDKAVIGSHSFGGVVSLAMAERFADRMKAMIFVAPLAFPEARLLEHTLIAPRSVPVFGPLWSWMAEKSRFDRAMLHLVHEVMFYPDDPPAVWKESYPYDQILDAHALVLQGEDAAAMLPMAPAGLIDVTKIGAPAHVVTGTSDKVVEAEGQAKLLGRLMPNARITELTGAGHMLHHTHADVVLNALWEAAGAASRVS